MNRQPGLSPHTALEIDFRECSLCVCPFFVDLSSVFHLSFKRSVSVRSTFNARFGLAFALNENGKVPVRYRPNDSN